MYNRTLVNVHLEFFICAGSFDTAKYMQMSATLGTMSPVMFKTQTAVLSTLCKTDGTSEKLYKRSIFH